MVLVIYACGQECSTTNFSKKVYFLNNKVTSPKRFYLFMVSRGDWLGKPANMKVESNGAVVNVGSFLTVQSPLFFVHKL